MRRVLSALRMAGNAKVGFRANRVRPQWILGDPPSVKVVPEKDFKGRSVEVVCAATISQRRGRGG